VLWRLSAPIRTPLLFLFRRDQHFAVAAAVDFEVGGGFRWRMIDPSFVSLL
jgi:hypothetical protein